MAAPLLGDFSCAPAYFEGCSVIDCQCVCNFDPTCLGTSYCLPASDHPPEMDCPISDHTYCSVYDHDAAMLANYLPAGDTGTGDTQAALRACNVKVRAQIERCNRQLSGSGGTDGGGPNGGGPNGGGPTTDAGASNGG